MDLDRRECRLSTAANRMLRQTGLVSLVISLFSGCSNHTTSPDQEPPPQSFLTGMRLIHAKDSTFIMGGNYSSSDALPVHSVTLTYDYWIDTTEVTQSAHRALMGVNPSAFTGNENRPVERVTWFDAVLYCNKRSISDSLDTVYSYTAIRGIPGNGCTELVGLKTDLNRNGYRLPTEAEWEYAYRAGTTTDYPWGTEDVSLYGWYYENSNQQTHPVAQKLPNRVGLYDMGGNVSEWCSDWYLKWARDEAQVDPIGDTSGTERTIRGGSWLDGRENLLSAYRVRDVPSYRTVGDVGFRCVLPLR